MELTEKISARLRKIGQMAGIAIIRHEYSLRALMHVFSFSSALRLSKLGSLQ